MHVQRRTCDLRGSTGCFGAVFGVVLVLFWIMSSDAVVTACVWLLMCVLLVLQLPVHACRAALLLPRRLGRQRSGCRRHTSQYARAVHTDIRPSVSCAMLDKVRCWYSVLVAGPVTNKYSTDQLHVSSRRVDPVGSSLDNMCSPAACFGC